MLIQVFSISTSGGHFVEGREAIYAISVEDYPRNISLKLF